MNNLRNILMRSDVIKAAFGISKASGQKTYLVGGAVRDLLINSRLGNDFDFVVEGKGIPLAGSFADKVGGTFFILDEKRDTSRVVSKNGFQADFSAMRGRIEEDLRLRDFTINSMAIPLDSIFETGVGSRESIILDPLDGRNDIEKRLIRASSQNSIQDDPLRIMRAFRLSSSLGFVIDDGLSDRIKKHCDELNTVSEERVRTEMFMVLGMPSAYKALREMDESGVLKTLFPEVKKWKGFYQGGWHKYDLFDHSMKAVEMLEEVLGDINTLFPRHGREIEKEMDGEMEAYVTRKGLVKLAALLHDSGKFYTRTMEGGRGRFLGHEKKGEEICNDIAKGLKLSRRSEMALRGLTANHMRILGLSKLRTVTDRAKYRFFKDSEGYGIDLLILSLADAMATPVEGKKLDEFKRLVQDLSGYYFDRFIKVPPAPLLTGEDVMRIFGIDQGKSVGDLLELLREAEVMGKVSTRKEAVVYLKNFLNTIG